MVRLTCHYMHCHDTCYQLHYRNWWFLTYEISNYKEEKIIDHAGNNFALASYSWLNSKTVAVGIQLFTAYPPYELTSTQILALLPRPRLWHLETQYSDSLQLVDVKFNHHKKPVM